MGGSNANAKKSFSRNQLVIMALGNIIGSGIFLGSGSVISLAGPAAVVAYAFGALIMTMEIMFICEMSVINPAPGSFRVHASEIFGPWMGFVNGWMFWCSGVLGMASEVAAAAVFTRVWFPRIPLWFFCIVYAAVMTAINLKDAKGLSRIESWLASIKVMALVIFIIFGFMAAAGIFSPDGLKPLPVLRSAESFLPNGIRGIPASMIMVMFSLTGTGIIGLAIAETEDPAKNAPPAISIIAISISLLYCLSIFFITLFVPWNSVTTANSPFVGILQKAGISFAGGVLNFIVLTASLSGLNSAMYSASRMLNSLSRDGQGPEIFLKTNKNGVPIYALGISSAFLLLTAVLSYLMPSGVFVVLAGASGFTAMFNWLIISATHFFYRKKTLAENPEKLKYKAPGYPYISVLAVLLILLVFATSPLYPGQVPGLIGSIALMIFLACVYFITEYVKKRNTEPRV